MKMSWPVLLGCLAVLLVMPHGVTVQERRVVRVSAERFSFTPSRIELRVGEEVDLVLTSDDTSHGFRIEGTDVDLAIPKRGPGEARVTVSFDKAGRYEFACDRMCGAGHNFMRGMIVVRDPEGRP
jgi:cytochrome c oxidase subunit 2